MVNTPTKPNVEELRAGAKAPAKETILTPRFYTTDFDEMAKMDLSINEDELRALVAEFRVDYNKTHFVRDERFDQSWEHIDGETRKLFIEFLERSCTAEFSGFLLYKELGRRLKDKNPLLAECFNLMSRDEARHAGFLNKAMADFSLSLDLGFLTKSHSYTFFKPKFIFYATYLSEKIGYWRYITIFRHLEAHPEHCVYPIFKLFENWCQDENRHGDFFDATMYLNDVQRAGFYKTIGLDPREYDKEVIEKTNQTAGRIFPVILNVEHPSFYSRLETCIANNDKLRAVDASGAIAPVKLLQKVPAYLSNAWQFICLYLMKPIRVDHLHGTVR
jgi:magnesium-protoporphyrin IX monomethyl ester (oxidative) cyclase